MLIYAQLEDAIITRVKAAQAAGTMGYRLAHIDSYGGEFDDQAFWDQFRRFPAVWVTVGGERAEPLSARDSRCTIKAAVMVGTRSPRGERLARRGFVGQPGSYQILDDIRQLLGGRRLGLDIGPLRPAATRTLYNARIGDQGLSVLALELEAVYTWTAPRDEPAAAPDLTGIELRYLVKPGDDDVDAVDYIPAPEVEPMPAVDPEFSTYIAAVPIAAGAVVALDAAGQAVPADCSVLAHAESIVGVSVAAADAGATVKVRTHELHENSAWQLLPGEPVFAGAAGAAVLNVPPSAVFARRVGVALSPTRLLVQLQPPLYF